MAHLSRDERTYDISLRIFDRLLPDRVYRRHRYHPPLPPSWPSSEYREFLNTPYVYTHARMYTYRWLIESKGRGRYKVCRPPRHETHALPLERRRRRTSSCSNVHLVSVDTPTLPACNGPRKKGDVGTTIVSAQRNIEPHEGSSLLHLVDDYEGIIVWSVRTLFLVSLPASLHRRLSYSTPLDFDFFSFFLFGLSLSLSLSHARACLLLSPTLRHRSSFNISLGDDRY